MERNINIKIDIDDRAPTSYNDLIKVGDSINLTIDLLSKGESVDLRDSSVELFLKKEDGTKVEQEVIIGDSKVSCTPLNIQSTTVVGQVCGELVVESSGKQVTSSTFIFNVEGSTSSEILEESKDDIATIKSLQNTIVNVNSVVEKYKTNIEAIAGTSESIEALAQIKIYAESAVTEIETVVNTGNTLKTSLESENTRAENNIQELNNLGSESIKTHINNTDIHVAASDKTKWDSYEQLISDNASHLNDLANEKGYAKVKIFNDPTDLNTMTESGIYASDKFTNTPNGNSTWRIVEVFNMTVTDTYAIQRCMGIANGGDKIYQRQCNNGTWTAWRELATTTPPTEYTITGLNGFATATGSKSVYFKTNDNVVTINCYLTASTPVTGTVILFNLPEGYRVKDGAAVRIISNLIRPIIIRADGTVQAICENTSEIYFNVSYKGV